MSVLLKQIALGAAGKGFEILLAIAQSIVVGAGDFAAEGAAIGQALINAAGQFIKDNWNPLDWFDVPDINPLGIRASGGAEFPKPMGSGNLKGLFGGGDANTPSAPPPVVFPAPDLTQYLAGLATAVTALQTTVGVLGAVAQGLAGPLGAAASAAIGAFNASLVSGWITAVQITIGGIGAIKGVAAGGSLFSEGSGLGASFGQGVLSGIAGYIGFVYAAGAAIGQAAINGAKSTIRPGSPSRAAIELFATVPQGAVKAMVDGLASVRAAGQRLAGAALIPPLVPTLTAARIFGNQQTNTAQMVSSQPTGRTGGGTTIINQNRYFALKSDEWLDMVRNNERGVEAAQYMDDLYPAFAGILR